MSQTLHLLFVLKLIRIDEASTVQMEIINYKFFFISKKMKAEMQILVKQTFQNLNFQDLQ